MFRPGSKRGGQGAVFRDKSHLGRHKHGFPLGNSLPDGPFQRSSHAELGSAVAVIGRAIDHIAAQTQQMNKSVLLLSVRYVIHVSHICSHAQGAEAQAVNFMYGAGRPLSPETGRFLPLWPIPG